MAETQIVVEAWAVLIAAGAIVASMLGTSLGVMFHLGGRIDHQSDRIDGVAAEVALVRERVARVEIILAHLDGSSGSPGPGPFDLT